MEEVKKGDLLFHGDAATAKKMGVNLSNTGMACAMCHPMGADTHPHSFPKFQVQMDKFATLRDMINWCIEKPNQGEKIDSDFGRDESLGGLHLLGRTPARCWCRANTESRSGSGVRTGTRSDRPM